MNSPLEHGDKNVVKGQCPNCERPVFIIYTLYCFAAEMSQGKERDEWNQALKRENPNRTKWTTKSCNRICSIHFVHGIPTKANTLPTMHIGYDTKRQKTRRPLFKHTLRAKKTRAEEGEIEIEIINNEVNQIESITKLS